MDDSLSVSLSLCLSVSVVSSTYRMFSGFGAILILLEFFAPDFIISHCSFLFNFLGRGLAYL